MRYTVIHLQTFEMKVVERVSSAEVEGCRLGTIAVVDMETGCELCLEDVTLAFVDSVEPHGAVFAALRDAA